MTRTTLKFGFSLLLVWGAACSNTSDEPASADGQGSRPQPAQSMPRSASASGAAVSFVTPQNGATVTSPFPVEFDIVGMEVARAGENVANTGHHHLLIDTTMPSLEAPVPADDNHVHFGDASTATMLTLPPGEHTLQLLFADYLHIPHQPPIYSDRITIVVQ